MIRIKQFWAKPLGKVIIIAITMILLVMLLAILATPKAQMQQLAKSMQSSQDSLIQGDVKLTTQETLKTIGGQETRLAHQMVGDEAARQHWEQEQSKHYISFKQQLLKVLQQEHQGILAQIGKLKRQQAITKNNVSETPKSENNYIIQHDQSTDPNSNIVWVKDGGEHTDIVKKDAVPTDSLLHSSEANSKESKVTPYYTIPENTALINVRPLQPLIGVIPTDGTVVDPETVLFSLGRQGLLANNQALPLAIKGMQGSATCTGIFNFNHSSVKCSITSLTFIFSDGRISTVRGSAENPLGKLTDHYGNDYIAGHYYGNAAYAAAGNAIFSGIQGWGGAFANSQVQTQTNAAGTFSSTTFKNADNYASGLALQNAGQSMNTWWNKLLKSTTNYVLVPNWNPTTHKLLLLNAVITAPVSINYSQIERKVHYAYNNNSDNASLD